LLIWLVGVKSSEPFCWWMDVFFFLKFLRWWRFIVIFFDFEKNQMVVEMVIFLILNNTIQVVGVFLCRKNKNGAGGRMTIR